MASSAAPVPPGADGPPGAADQPAGAPGRVEIRRSRRRTRTVSAYREADRTVVLLPAGLPRADEQRWVAEMLRRLAAREARGRRSDADLLDRARALSRRYLDGRAEPAGVRWVGNQHGRWGSCTPADRTIRLSRRLQDMPRWVVDYVLLHELAHLLVPGHGPEFWDWVGRYPRTERARGYLEGVVAGAGLAGLGGAEDPDGAQVEPGAAGGGPEADEVCGRPGTDRATGAAR